MPACRSCGTASTGDRSSQTSIQLVRGQLLAVDEDPAADRHLRRALELVDETDSPLWGSDVRSGVARSLAPTRREEAIAFVQEARQLAERKELLVIVERAQGMLDELGT